MSVCVDARLFRLNLTTECNVNCGCSLDVFDPVCGNDGFQYFSSCHAGCTQFINLNADPSDVPGRLVSSIVHIFISIVLHKVGLQETKEAFQSLSVSVSEESIYVSDEALSVCFCFRRILFCFIEESVSVYDESVFVLQVRAVECRCISDTESRDGDDEGGRVVFAGFCGVYCASLIPYVLILVVIAFSINMYNVPCTTIILR